MEEQIDIFKALNFIRDNAEKYAQAKAERIYLEEWKKSKKAMLMKQAEIEGVKASTTQERDACCHPEYIEVLQEIKIAVANEEKLRRMLEAAKLRIDAWRTIESNKRAERII